MRDPTPQSPVPLKYRLADTLEIVPPNQPVLVAYFLEYFGYTVDQARQTYVQWVDASISNAGADVDALSDAAKEQLLDAEHQRWRGAGTVLGGRTGVLGCLSGASIRV